jgi:hypothetical protein
MNIAVMCVDVTVICLVCSVARGDDIINYGADEDSFFSIGTTPSLHCISQLC